MPTSAGKTELSVYYFRNVSDVFEKGKKRNTLYTYQCSQVGEIITIYVHAAIQVSLTVKEEVDLQLAVSSSRRRAGCFSFLHCDHSNSRKEKRRGIPFRCRETISENLSEQKARVLTVYATIFL